MQATDNELERMMNRAFPLLKDHETVPCFNCGGDIWQPPIVESGYARGRGQYRAFCSKCCMYTFYDARSTVYRGHTIAIVRIERDESSPLMQIEYEVDIQGCGKFDEFETADQAMNFARDLVDRTAA